MMDNKGIDTVFNELLEYFDYLKTKNGNSADLQLAEHYLKRCENHVLRELHFGGNDGKDI